LAVNNWQLAVVANSKLRKKRLIKSVTNLNQMAGLKTKATKQSVADYLMQITD
jgi:hypothetical protein